MFAATASAGTQDRHLYRPSALARARLRRLVVSGAAGVVGMCLGTVLG